MKQAEAALEQVSERVQSNAISLHRRRRHILPLLPLLTPHFRCFQTRLCLNCCCRSAMLLLLLFRNYHLHTTTPSFPFFPSHTSHPYSSSPQNPPPPSPSSR